MQLDSLHDSLVALDSGPLIYFIERNATYIDTVRPFFVAMASGQFQVVTSIVTLAEVLVRPFREGSFGLVQQYREILLHSTSLEIRPVTPQIAETTARIRATYGSIRTPDAIHLATAITVGAPYFLTNDAGLPNLPNLQILLVDQLAQK